MVARIQNGKSIYNALTYNEQKLRRGQAECLQAFNFIKDVPDLNFDDKFWHFERLTSLNQRTRTNSLQVSLNFHPSEKLSNKQLEEISRRYMQKIGFEGQPYLLYRHYDAAHPHVHIVSTNIQADGKRISLHNLAINQSMQAARDIEREFGLIQAIGRRSAESTKLHPLHSQKLSYGKSELMMGISNVLREVIGQYKFTSLADLNAVLRLYNVMADRGRVGSYMYNHRGLYYRVLDEKGNKVGVPVKASAIYFRPTLDYLAAKFVENEGLRIPHKQRIKATIDWVLAGRNLRLADLTMALERQRISTVLQPNKEKPSYGINFVDHQTKCVFSGSDLGKQYTAEALFERCDQKYIMKQMQSLHLSQKKDLPSLNRKEKLRLV